MAGYRRVTKSENYKAWKNRDYTRAAPGKFRKSSKVISRRQYEKLVVHPGISREKAIRERQKTRSSLTYAKGRVTRQRNRVLEEALGPNAKIGKSDNALINKWYRVKWEGLDVEEKEQFREMFTRYPQDILRAWLGSGEVSARRYRPRLAA